MDKRPLEKFYGIAEIMECPFLAQDGIRFLIGDKLGAGQYREVYSFDFIPNTVIKVCPTKEPANFIEYQIWQEIKDTKYAKWFAPCLHISPEGQYLIQKRCRLIKPTDKLPKKLPGFFTDTHTGNFGYIGKQLVCFDYQFITRALDISFNENRIVEWQ